MRMNMENEVNLLCDIRSLLVKIVEMLELSLKRGGGIYSEDERQKIFKILNSIDGQPGREL
jgi:hypothetical protein